MAGAAFRKGPAQLFVEIASFDAEDRDAVADAADFGPWEGGVCVRFAVGVVVGWGGRGGKGGWRGVGRGIVPRKAVESCSYSSGLT